MNRIMAAIGGALGLFACSSTPQPSQPTPAATPVTSALGCESALQSCDCPDGTATGLQTCDVVAGLSPCSCLTSAVPPMAAAGGGASAPVPPPSTAVTRVCSQLEGIGSCEARSFRSAELPASILFVLDRSGSMACNPPPVQTIESCNAMPLAADPSKPSRWEITVDALNGVFGTLENSNAGVGLSFFSVDNACGVNSTPSVGIHEVSKPQREALAAALHGITPRGGTPIVGAVTLGYAHLHEEAKAPGKRFLVLLTDGEESCGFKDNEDDKADLAAARKHLLEIEVQKARSVNIRTFVIGAPGSEHARGFLSSLAFAGGTARQPNCAHGNPDSDVGDCHYDLTQGGDFAKILGDALADISGQALNCEFPVPTTTGRQVNVQVTASTEGAAPLCLPFDAAPCDGGANGFQFGKRDDGSDDLSKVILCGAACEQVRRDPGSTVDVILGCDAVLQ
ncbi:MAG: vWA domain-containing protein [Polyangiales bacterium]